MPRIGNCVLSRMLWGWVGFHGLWTLEQRTPRGLTALHLAAQLVCQGDRDAPKVPSQLLDVCRPEDSDSILPREGCVSVTLARYMHTCPPLQFSRAMRMPTPSHT